MNKRLNKTAKENKKWKIVKIIGGVSFLVFGTVFGIISLYLNNWDIVRFITNPTTDLVLLCSLAVGIFFLANLEIK